MRSKWEIELPHSFLEKINTPPVEEVQGLENIVCGSGGFGSTRVSEKNDISEKKELKGENERTEKKNDKVKNETMKGSSSDRKKTDRNRKMTEGTSKLSYGRQIISIKQLKRLVKKKTPFFLVVVWDRRIERLMLK